MKYKPILVKMGNRTMSIGVCLRKMANHLWHIEKQLNHKSGRDYMKELSDTYQQYGIKSVKNDYEKRLKELENLTKTQ